MSRVPAVLATLGGVLLAITALVTDAPRVPDWLPLVVVLVATLVAAIGAWIGRPPVHVVGIALAVAGAGLVDLDVSWTLLFIGAFGAVLLVTSLTLALALPGKGGHARVVPLVLVLAAIAAGLGTLLARTLAEVGGGGLDARASVAAWVVLAIASTWLIARRAGRSSS